MEPAIPHPQPPPPSDASSYWEAHMRYIRAEAITVPPFKLQNSLRIWFQAYVHQVTDLNDCPPHTLKYMPLVIQRWIRTLPQTTRESWELFKDALLRRFGKPVEEENKLLYKALIDLKQKPGESVSLHAANWEHQLSLLVEKLNTNQQSILFVQSLAQRNIRRTLLNWIDDKQPTSISEVIDKALRMETLAETIRELQQAASAPSPSYDPNAMDIHNIQRGRHHKHKQRKPHHKQRQSKTAI